MLLRLAIGFHFYLEGVDKLRNPKPFTAAFFGAAKGPYAEFFHRHVWDANGLARLDGKGVQDAWEQYAIQAGRYYGYDDQQKSYAKDAVDHRSKQLNDFLADIKDDIEEYEKGLERRRRQLAEPARSEVPSLRGQTEKWESELKSKRNRWLAMVDGLAKDLERDLFEIAAPAKRQRGALPVLKPGRRPLDSEAFDEYVPYFDLAVGALLVLGLAVRPAALAGAGFLAMVVATQWPGTPGAMPVYYQTVEACALLALAGIGAGRYAGLDSVFSYCCGRCCRAKNR